ncbi:MAG: cytochrome c3 family protein [Spirochaetes bacterium]|nr:cytochrome c3 family protein [Spirochaetota bacterium]
MISKYKTKFPVIIIILLAVTGTIGYLMEDEANPIRVHFETKGGSVVFTHKTHIEEYADDCTSCHHNAVNDETDAEAWRCRNCHIAGGDADSVCEDRPLHKQCIGANCIDCHEENGMEPGDCGFCHR